MKTTLKELAEKLNGTYWEKEHLRRIYLEEGHNTKKMKTKTFVWQDEDGNFIVSCRIDCPSQPWEWIKSQQDEIKESVYKAINFIIQDKLYAIQDNVTKMYYDCLQDLESLEDAEKYLSYSDAEEEAENSCINNYKIVEVENN